MSGYYETRVRDIEETNILGYDRILVHRPKFIYFEYEGLRPSTPHWMFFGNREVTNFVNTSYTKAAFEGASRTSILKEPGETFINATQFPTGSGLAFGGPTVAGGASAPLFSTANGTLKGLFYLQSNSTINFPMTMDGTELLAIDILDTNKNNSSSYGAGLFSGVGQYENYYTYVTQESYEVWIDTTTDNDDGGSGNWYVDENGHIRTTDILGIYAGTESEGYGSHHDAFHAKHQQDQKDPEHKYHSDKPGTIRIGDTVIFGGFDW